MAQVASCERLSTSLGAGTRRGAARLGERADGRRGGKQAGVYTLWAVYLFDENGATWSAADLVERKGNGGDGEAKSATEGHCMILHGHDCRRIFSRERLVVSPERVLTLSLLFLFSSVSLIVYTMTGKRTRSMAQLDEIPSPTTDEGPPAFTNATTPLMPSLFTVATTKEQDQPASKRRASASSPRKKSRVDTIKADEGISVNHGSMALTKTGEEEVQKLRAIVAQQAGELVALRSAHAGLSHSCVPAPLLCSDGREC